MAVIWKTILPTDPKSAWLVALVCQGLVCLLLAGLILHTAANGRPADGGHCPYDTITERTFCGEGESLAAYHDRVKARLCEGSDQ